MDKIVGSTYKRCLQCGSLSWSASHRCTAYQIKILERIPCRIVGGLAHDKAEDYSKDNWVFTRYGADPENAARKWIARYENDCAEYEVASEEVGYRVLVYKDDPSEEGAREFIITGYTAPTYNAESVERKFKFEPEPEEVYEDEEEVNV